MRVVVPTCKQYYWALGPFAYCLNTYWSEDQPVVIGGFEPLDFWLPPNYHFHQIAKESYPAEKWSDGLIALFQSIEDYCFVLMLEDYWLCRGVDHAAIQSLEQYMRIHPDVLRIDLTADRLHSGRAVDVDTWGHLDIIETDNDTPYQWSTQAAIVNRENFLRCLRPGISPWEWELQGPIPDGLRVLGTRNYPVRYVNAIGMGLDKKHLYRLRHVREGMGGKTVEEIEETHVSRMKEYGLLPKRER